MNVALNIDEISGKQLHAQVCITPEQTQRIIAEWLKGQGIIVDPNAIIAKIDHDYDDHRFDGFSFTLPLNVSFPKGS